MAVTPMPPAVQTEMSPRPRPRSRKSFASVATTFRSIDGLRGIGTAAGAGVRGSSPDGYGLIASDDEDKSKTKGLHQPDRLKPKSSLEPWTDDRNNLFQILK